MTDIIFLLLKNALLLANILLFYKIHYLFHVKLTGKSKIFIYIFVYLKNIL